MVTLGAFKTFPLLCDHRPSTMPQTFLSSQTLSPSHHGSPFLLPSPWEPLFCLPPLNVSAPSTSVKENLAVFVFVSGLFHWPRSIHAAASIKIPVLLTAVWYSTRRVWERIRLRTPGWLPLRPGPCLPQCSHLSLWAVRPGLSATFPPGAQWTAPPSLLFGSGSTSHGCTEGIVGEIRKMPGGSYFLDFVKC